MKYRLLILVCLALYPALLVAAPPQAIITGPSAGQPGDILVLDATQSIADYYAWQVTPELPGGRPTILMLEQGKKCLIASVPGEYTVFLSVSNNDGIDTTKWKVTVGNNPTPNPPGPKPPKPIPPGPDPEPDPVLPDGEFGISKDVRDWAQQVSSPQKKAEAHKLAGGIESVSAAIAAGTIKAPQDVLTQLKITNNVALGKNVSFWEEFGKKISNKIRELYLAGRLKTMPQWSKLLDEIALGLKAVK